MSELLQSYKLSKEMYFNQPPDEHVRQELSSINDPDKIVNLSHKVHSPEISTGPIKKAVTEDIDKNLENNIPNETEVDKNPIESVKDILQQTHSESRLFKEQSPKKNEQEEMTGGSKAGALSFNASNLPKTAGALAFNDDELV